MVINAITLGLPPPTLLPAYLRMQCSSPKAHDRLTLPAKIVNRSKLRRLHNSLGQRTSISNALGEISHTFYDAQGHTLATWGTGYPVAYQFDTAGRMIALATTRSNTYANVNLTTLLTTGDNLNDGNVAALDVTQWLYDESTGLLSEKVYADGKGIVYTYTDTGRIATRTWARGAVTTYSYNTLGQLTAVDYSLWSTPDVTYTHDRIGRVLSVVSTASTNIFEYTGLSMTKETQNGYVIDRPRDDYGRTTGYALTIPGESVPVTGSIYGFNNYGAFNSVISLHGADTNIFTYGYLPGTYLIESMTADAGFNWSRSYEADRNLITSVSNLWNTSVISAFGYANDELGRRTKRTDYFNSLSVTNDFDYNIRGEITEAIMDNGNESYNYDYDPIGNRKWSQLNTVTNNYTANQLNQYSAVSGGMTTSPTHDEDGNMTWDGSFYHSWDAENRLISSSNEVAGVYITYAYDNNNRRISKTTLTPDPFSSLTSKYIWDGWNIIVELITDHVETNTTMNSYAWGLDLSGSLQGAGGVGGLLAVTEIDSGTNTYYACADANGSVVGVLNESGNTVAHYEYDSFGNTISSSGDMDDDFRFRFSSKYYDAETGLYYYGFRYYDPVLGRWLSRDPIGEIGGDNLYGFVNNDAVSKWDYLGLRTRLEDMEAHAFLQAVVVAARANGRPLTAKFLALYLDENNNGKYELSHSEVMSIISNERFRKSLKNRARTVIISNGDGNISHNDSGWSNHRFYNSLDPDMWSAFNDLRFKIGLDGCVKKEGSDQLNFKGQFTVDLMDNYSFGNPATAHRTPFMFFDFLPDRYENMTEQRFLDLETRGWVKPFRIEGKRQAKYSITVSRSSPSTEMTYDPYN